MGCCESLTAIKWAPIEILVTISFVLVNIHIGECATFPSQWSTIQDMFESMEDLYPKNDHHAEKARYALHGYRGEGDILYEESAPTPKGIRGRGPSSAAIKGNTYRWPGFPGRGRIPYVISKKLHSIKGKILKAMNQYEKHTCIRFVPKKKKDKDYIYIRFGRGCSSFVGRLGGKQYVTLGKGCEYVGTIVHELGHVIGLIHEHQRYNRNDFIWIYPRNIAKGQQDNFDRFPKRDQIVYNKYDYDSIMQYGEYAFSISSGRLRTMRAKKKGVTLRDPYQKPGLDNMDVRQVNLLYEC